MKKILENPFFYNAWSFLHFTARMEQIKKIISKVCDPSVLDLGCGTGLLKRSFPGCRYTGIDNNKSYVDYNKKKNSGRFIYGDITQLNGLLDLDNESFDFIILNGVLHHMDSDGIDSMLAQLGKYLNPDGRIVVIDLIDNGHLNWINKLLIQKDRGHFIRDKKEYLLLLEKHFELNLSTDFTINIGTIIFWRLASFVLARKKVKDSSLSKDEDRERTYEN